MKVHSRMISPVKKADGTWTTVIEEFEEDIPDLGRETLFCNSCTWPGYPECKKFCKGWQSPKTIKS